MSNIDAIRIVTWWTQGPDQGTVGWCEGDDAARDLARNHFDADTIQQYPIYPEGYNISRLMPDGTITVIRTYQIRPGEDDIDWDEEVFDTT